MKRLKEEFLLPWCVDFNNTILHTEKRGGNPYPNSLIDGFSETASTCGLIDVDLIGHQFTWEKSRGTPNWIEVRLDRAMTNL